jgi:hypothetical protein
MLGLIREAGMSEKNENQMRSKRQDQFIVALLEHSTLDKSAAALGVSDVTLWRTLKKPEFAEAFRKARREAFSNRLPGCSTPRTGPWEHCCAS